MKTIRSTWNLIIAWFGKRDGYYSNPEVSFQLLTLENIIGQPDLLLYLGEVQILTNLVQLATNNSCWRGTKWAGNLAALWALSSEVLIFCTSWKKYSLSFQNIDDENTVLNRRKRPFITHVVWSCLGLIFIVFNICGRYATSCLSLRDCV